MVLKNVGFRSRETRLNYCVKHGPISHEYANVTHAVGLLRACGERPSADRTAERGNESIRLAKLIAIGPSVGSSG